MFQGVATALITPFKNDKIDLHSFENLLNFQLECNIHALLVCGSTGESNFLNPLEREQLIKKTVEKAKGKCPVIVGTAAYSTQDTISLTQSAKQLGANAVLIVPPPYVKPTQEGIFQYFKDVHDAVDIPIILYDNPGRAIVKIELETIERLAELPRIIGLKDATGDLTRPALIRAIVSDDFMLYSGEDATAASFLAEGGHGCISVVANIAPAECVDLQNAWTQKDLSKFFQLRDALALLSKALFCESNPVPVKYGASLLRLCESTPRKPLLPATSTTQETVRIAMEKSNVLPLQKTSQTG